MKKVVLISGCTSGIGKSLAQKMANEGHSVYAGARNVSDLDGLDKNIRAVTLDVNNPQDIINVMALIEKHHRRLDILVNNAGYGAMGPLIEVPISQVQAQFATNVFAPLNMAQQALPLLRKNKGLVVNIGSSAGIFTVPFSGVYCASKAAMHALSEVLRMEIAPFNVRVMTVYPGAIASAFGDNAAAKLKDTLAKNSLYTQVMSAVEKRARVSSNSPTTPEMFANKLMSLMLSKRPPFNVGIGHGSRAMPWAKKLLPTRLREFLMARAYLLNNLSA
ncbi:MAG: SDR family NAD(P)-dependent oxidoreductase [Bermanella sp.]